MSGIGYFRVGDHVTHGDSGTLMVTGFKPLYVGRLSAYQRPPGVYAELSEIALATPDTGLQMPRYYHPRQLRHVNSEIAAMRERHPRTPGPQRVADLPHTVFQEGDYVSVAESQPGYIVGIDYAQLVGGSDADDARYKRFYIVGPSLRPTRITPDPSHDWKTTADGRFVSTAEISLLNASPVRNRDASGAPWFDKPVDEIYFRLMMGHFEEAGAHPQSVDEARELLYDGSASGFFITGGINNRHIRCVSLTHASDAMNTKFFELSLASTEDFPAFQLP